MTFSNSDISTVEADVNAVDYWKRKGDRFEVSFLSADMKAKAYHFFGLTDEEWDDYNGWIDAYALGDFSREVVTEVYFTLVSMDSNIGDGGELCIKVSVSEGASIYHMLRKSEAFREFGLDSIEQTLLEMESEEY